VEEAKLEQIGDFGCTYRWKSEDDKQTVIAALGLIWVGSDAEAARKSFDDTTKSLSADELRAQLAELQTDGGMDGAFVPDAGHQYEDVEGVGDAARALQYDGSLTVLVGNMTFNVSAYKGDAVPP